MGVEERCLHQLVDNPASPNGIYQNGCRDCSYDPRNNPRCPGYFRVKVISLEVREKTTENVERN
jgi:hypothetical protein